DLGNDFYKLWLDPTMNYSSAWFAGAAEGSLDAAQGAKMRRALAEAGVGEGSRVLEIGCGWGAVAEVAARDFGARLTGVTLSTEQLAWAQRRLADAG
ncbi:class I SAM-dependent methyltransferase, partial [Acinetobacter baumannii]